MENSNHSREGHRGTASEQHSSSQNNTLNAQQSVEPKTVTPNNEESDHSSQTAHEVERNSTLEHTHQQSHFQPIVGDGCDDEEEGDNNEKQTSPPPPKRKGSVLSQSEMMRMVSRQKTGATSLMTDLDPDNSAELERLISRMFGTARHERSDEKTRHLGVVFQDLTVKGLGLGAALQSTVGDIFLTIPRNIAAKIKGKAVAHRPPTRTILHHMTGCIRPGEMLLVLGRPGSGCSTFLKTLGLQVAEFESVEGTVKYGGVSAETMHKSFRGEVLYNPEDDLHYGPLTVKQTLDFALKTRTPGKEFRLEGETRSQYVTEFRDDITQLFWISHTLDTRVGDERLRGISGGEKKRVSIAEAMITKASVQMWDNSTRGLDSSTALEYVLGLRAVAKMANVSTAVALYQAGESLFELFDKVLLIDEGRCCFYGRTEDAAEYFENLGFERPARWTTADFLTSVTDIHGRHVKEGWDDRVPRNAEQFEEAFKKSAMCIKNIKDVNDFERDLEEQSKERDSAATKIEKKNYTLPFHQQIIACTSRQFAVIKGDMESLVTRWGGVVFLAFIVGSLFYNLPPTSQGVFTRGGVIFFTLLFNSLLALAEMGSSYAARPIMLKHKTFSFYSPAAYAISLTVVDLILVGVQVIIWNIIVYFLAGLQRTASQFFISTLLIYLLALTMYSFFRAIGSLSTSLDIAARFTGLAIQAFVVYTGYLIPPDKMHPWLSWLRWINPVGYGFEALMANEFYNLNIRCVPPNLVPQGPDAQPTYQSCTIQGSKPGQVIVLGADYIETAYGYTRSHLWRNVGIIIAFWVLFIFATIIGMETRKVAQDGGSVTVFKRGQVPKSIEEAIQTGEVDAHDIEKGGAGSEKLVHDEQDPNTSEAGKGVAGHEAVFTFSNVNYTIPVKNGSLQLLQNVDGYVQPGRLTALMGASGAGKTTLLNTLAQRVNFGVVSGDFLVDGKPLPTSFQRSTGFAEQMDVHEPTATVREALQFSALLRRPKTVPIEEKFDYVEQIIDLLEMRDIAGAVIGHVGNGLAQEQRKRVTIGVELAAKPELLLFLDEPTSGLDSQAAYNIVRFLRKLASAGQAILCTIHQPSAVLFEEFDDLLLLKSGGRTVYHGPLGQGSEKLIEYFESHGAKRCPPAMNPAEYMLDAIGAGDPSYKGKDWGDVWANSDERQQRLHEIQDMIQARQQASSAVSKIDEHEFAMPISTQIVAVTKRNFVSYWRSPQYVVGKYALHIITALFNTFTFWKMGESAIDMQDRLFSIFMTFTIAPPLIQQLQPRYLNLRNIYKVRESSSKIYSWVAFVIAAILPELPYSIVAGTIYFNCWYWGCGFPKGVRALYCWMMIMLFELFYVSFGMGLASIAPNDVIAMLLVPIFFLFVSAFSGIVVPYEALPAFWKNWMYWLSPFHYLFEGLMSTVSHDVPVRCSSSEYAKFSPPPGLDCQTYAGNYTLAAGGYLNTASDGTCEICAYKSGDVFAAGFNAFYKYRWRDYGIFWSYCIFNFTVVFFGTWMFLCGIPKIKARLSERKNRRLRETQGKGRTDSEATVNVEKDS